MSELVQHQKEKSRFAIHLEDGESVIEYHLKDGIIDYALNLSLDVLTGKDQAIDFKGRLAPTEAYGMFNTFVGLLAKNLTELLNWQ